MYLNDSQSCVSDGPQLHALSVRRELDIAHRLFEVEVMKDCTSACVHEKGPSVCETVSTQSCIEPVAYAPSSTEIKTFPSGLRAITEIFLRFSNGNVKLLLLYYPLALLWLRNPTGRTSRDQTQKLCSQLGCRASFRPV